MKQYRPTYHFMPEKNWMNDPNGPIFYMNEYHMFYQHNPYSERWDTMHWGHAKSKDLVHWEHLPIALYPSNERGEHHCFSGCTVIDDAGNPRIFYTSIGIEERNALDGAEQWMAVSSDDMLTWQKPERNPIMTAAIHGDTVITDWRDPFVWKDGDNWLMLVGGTHKERGCAAVYKSTNLQDWTYLHIMLDGEEPLWECPNLFKLGEKYLLLYSPGGPVRYYIGTLDADYKFTPDNSKHGYIDFSGWEGYYAPTGTKDGSGRHILWGWMPDTARGEFEGEWEWTGVHSIPRILSLNHADELIMVPAPELQELRGEQVSYADLSIGQAVWNTGVRGRALEIAAVVEAAAPAVPGDGAVEAEAAKAAGSFAISLFRSEDGAEETVFEFHAADGSFVINRSASSLSPFPHKTELAGSVNLAAGEPVELRIFTDYSTVEVFVNGKECLSARVYPLHETSDGVYLRSLSDGDVRFRSLDIWQMQPIRYTKANVGKA